MKNQFWEDLIIEGTEDEIGLWEVIHDIKSQYPEIKPPEIKSMTLEAIREILETGFMKIATYGYVDNQEPPYEIWDLDIDSIVRRLEKEWDELGREPIIADIAWLINTKKGDKEAERLLEERRENAS